MSSTEEEMSNSIRALISPPNKRRNQSQVWNYMKKNENGSFACNVDNCSKIYSERSARTTLSYHLFNQHGIRVKDEDTPITSAQGEDVCKNLF